MGARVLVVDDDPWILRMVTATLEKRSYVVDTAREGRQALERAQANPPDVIISDVMMPVMDGWTFVQHLRQDPRLSAIPVIFLTALGKDEARLLDLGLGPEDFLAKPFRFDDLEKRVSGALARTGSGVRPLPGGPPGPQRHPTPGYVNPTPVNLEPPTPRPPRNYTPPPSASPGDARPPNQPYPGYPPTPFGQPGYPGPYPYPGYPPGYPGYPPQGYYPPFPHPGEGQPPGPPGPGGPPPTDATQDPSKGPVGSNALSSPPSTAEIGKVGTGSFPAQRRTTALNGRLEQLGLSSLLVMMEMERKDGVLTLKQSNSADVGRIFIRGGQVICAKLDAHKDRAGRDCVYEMLRWKQGTFSFNAMEVDMEDTVQSSTTHLLMEGARLIDEANREDDETF